MGCTGCETRPDDYPHCEYCPYCKYCTYCKLCDYCEDGGALSRLTQSVSNIADSVLNMFSQKDQGLAKKAQKEMSEDDLENLDDEKLEEIYQKFQKDSTKKEI